MRNRRLPPEPMRVKGRRLTSTQIVVLRDIAQGGRYIITADGKRADVLRWLRGGVMPYECRSVRYLFKQGLVEAGTPWDLDIDFFNVRITEKGAYVARTMKTLAEIEIEQYNLTLTHEPDQLHTIRCPRCSKEYKAVK